MSSQDVNKYEVILADPPWNYKNSGCRGAAENEYKTMQIEDICNLPVSEISAENSVLILWATWPQLIEAMDVIKSWGFDYITGFPWVKITSIGQSIFEGVEIKVPYGIGFWARGCTEMVLISRKGKPKPPPNGFIGLLSPNLFHSRKPDDVYDFAEAITDGKKIELFARRKRDGWDVWGNEVESDISLARPDGNES